jgi:hypothetical protein
MTRATARQVCAHFVDALERHGLPEEILTDNGKVFTGRFGLKPAEVLFDKICRENGIAHLLTAPRSPTTTGKIERFHRTLRTEFLTGKLFSTAEVAQKELTGFVGEYNEERPHRSLKMRTPAEVFKSRGQGIAPQLPLDRSQLDEDRTGDDWVSRTVSVVGTISVSNQVFSLGKHRGGHTVDIKVTERFLEAWDGAELVKTVLRTSEGVIRKKRAEKH